MSNSLKVERWWPAITGLVFAVGWMVVCTQTPAQSSHTDVFDTTMSLASITVGFLATAMSIVISAPDSAFQTELADSGYLTDLIHYLKEPFIVGIALASLCMIGFVAPTSVVEASAFWAAWAGLSAWMVAGLWRVGHIFVCLMHMAGETRVKAERDRKAQMSIEKLPD